ncbi:MAG: sugar phosphate isomerase/epimerase [Oscillospiraceae bacterium]
MKAGVSTACLYPMETENALELLGSLGIKNVEIFVNTISETSKEFSRQIIDILNKYSMTVSSIHPYTCGMEGMYFFSDYQRRLDDGIEIYKRYFEFAREVGAKLTVLHGAPRMMKFEDERYFERFYRLDTVAREFGVILAQENVERSKSGNIDFIKRMKKALPDVNFVLDTKQSIRAGYSPYEMLEAMKNNICHIHLSDSTKCCECMPLGMGNFDVKNFLKTVKLTCYSCDVIVELYRDNFSEPTILKENYDSLRDIICVL